MGNSGTHARLQPSSTQASAHYWCWLAARAVDSSRINHIQEEEEVVPRGVARCLRSMAQVAWDRWPPAGRSSYALPARRRRTRGRRGRCPHEVNPLTCLSEAARCSCCPCPLLTKFSCSGRRQKAATPSRGPTGNLWARAAAKDSKLQLILLYAAKYRGCAFWPPLAHTHPFQLPRNGLKVRGGGGPESQRRGHAKDLCSRLLQTSSTARCGGGQCPTYLGLNARNCSKALR